MAAVQPVEVNAQGHSVYRWVEEWPECFWWKANAHMLILEDDELDYTIEYAPNCCNSYVHAYNPEGQKTSVPPRPVVRRRCDASRAGGTGGRPTRSSVPSPRTTPNSRCAA